MLTVQGDAGDQTVDDLDALEAKVGDAKLKKREGIMKNSGRFLTQKILDNFNFRFLSLPGRWHCGGGKLKVSFWFGPYGRIGEDFTSI